MHFVVKARVKLLLCRAT